MKYKYSLVIPIMNEEESIPNLFEAIKLALHKDYEIIAIDDGSTDGSLKLLQEAAKKHPFIRVISFRRNLGKSPALTHGFHVARGEIVVMMDADLQDDPAEIPKLVEKLNEGFDLASGWRRERRDSALKVVSSRFFNGLMTMLFQLKVNDLNCGLKAMRHDLARELYLYGGMHRFIPIIAHELGFTTAEVPITHHERKYGVSKYKPTKILTDIPDLATIYFLTKYTSRPLHFFTKIGAPIFLLGALSLVYLLVVKLFGESIGQRPLLIFGVLFVITGIQVMLTGLIADLIVNLNRRDISDFPVKFDSGETK